MASPPDAPTQLPQSRFSSLWTPAVINPVNLKSYTLPILNLKSPYARNFHLSWLGFFVAFLSWFAFPPLFPEAIRDDLGLTPAQVANSNIVALTATLLVRIVVGPAVDRYGPRKVMAVILILGAIPSGLAGAVSNVQGLYAIRFFIGILGASFVPCQAWTSVFFDKSIVGTANALVGGWGNAGGGATYAVMVSLYSRLHQSLSQHVAWRVAFVVVPVPALLLTAILTMVFGTDHPGGHWENRHEAIAQSDAGKETPDNEKDSRGGRAHSQDSLGVYAHIVPIDVAVNEVLDTKSAYVMMLNTATWLPCLSYMTTFGFELAVDSSLSTTLLSTHPSLGQLNAGYLASVFGLLNVFTRPLGGYLTDVLYAKWGVQSKKFTVLALAGLQGVFSIAFGQFIQTRSNPSLGGVMAFIVVTSIFNGMANGANFSLVPHCNPSHNGVMTGLVGSFGNLGGIVFALIFRFQPQQGIAWWISGVLTLSVNAALCIFSAPPS